MADLKERYGAKWKPEMSDIEIERACIRKGGQWTGKSGNQCGLGLYQHYKNLQTLLWPWKKWHRWNELVLSNLVSKRIIGIIGPANSAKTHEAAAYSLTKYLCFPECTAVLISSTDTRSLELRIWGEIKKLWSRAKNVWEDAPGNITGSKQMITTDSVDDEVRDFRNGIIGIPCFSSGNFVGLGKYVGIKNENVLLVGDEASLMVRAYFDSISNLIKNTGFQCLAMGNPKDRTDALGLICEPSETVGGWESLDQTEKTKVWPTRFEGGVCIQLVGTDSPNFDVPEGAPVPFPFLIKRKDIDNDLKFYGRESLQFSMMNLGMFPKDAAARRVITRTMCVQFGALEEPVWDGMPEFSVAGLDAAYGNTGGDRCMFTHLDIGYSVDGKQIMALHEAPMVVPVSAKKSEIPEDQIARWCMDECIARGIPPENFGFDSTGKGTLATALSRIWSPHVLPIEFGGKPTERPVSKGSDVICRNYYSKFVSELWYMIRLIIEAGQFRGMTEDVLSEGCMREWTIVAGNKIEVESKDKTKIRMGRSPDIFDSLVAACEVARRRGFQIEKLGNTDNTRKSMDWLNNLRDKYRKLNTSKQLKPA